METDPNKSSEHYIHRLNYNRRERMVGVFVFFAVVLFAVLIVVGGKSQHLFEKRVTFYIDVHSSEGISPGNVVKILGSDVGQVVDLWLVRGRKIRVEIEVYERRHNLVRADAEATVNRLTGIGNALIEIEPGSVDQPVLADGSIIPVHETPSLNELVLGIARIIESADKTFMTKIEAILPDLEQTVGDAQKIIAQIATGHGTVGAAVFDQDVEQDLKRVVKSGAEILQEADGLLRVVRQRFIDLEPVIANAALVTDDVHRVTKSLPEMVVELKKTIVLTNAAMTLVNEELRDLPGLTLELRRTLARADRLLQSTQNIWPLSTAVPEHESRKLIPPHAIHD
jgi:phospholipid/cholesterol/gamma-HCH transport system substrate-binding protein